MGGILDWPDLDDMIAYLIPALRELGLQALDISCANSDYHQTSGRIVRMVRPLWDRVILAGASLSIEDAETELQEGWVDAITWGRAFIANPDLVRKIETRQPWTEFTMEMRDTLV
jgi:2,4-dienoyl-CoA reductase-like NADH-dependent reductase (Old Yellow Enzyme family)